MKITIAVQDEHIAAGCKKDYKNCPIARALAVHLKPGTIFDILGNCYFVQGMEYMGNLPAEAIEFIWAFDHDRTVQSFSFEMEVPDEALVEVEG